MMVCLINFFIMKNTSLDIVDDSASIKSIPAFQGASHSVVPSFSPMESLRFSTSVDSEGIKSLIYLSDMYLVLNSERIQAVLGEDTTRSLFNQMASNYLKPSSINDAFNNLSDADKMAFLKSRFLQTPSEIQSWYSGLISRFGSLLNALNEENEEIVNSRESKEVVSGTSSDSSKTE